MVYYFTRISFNILRKRTLTYICNYRRDTHYSIILCRWRHTMPCIFIHNIQKDIILFQSASIRLRPKVYVEITSYYYSYFEGNPRFPSTSHTSWGPSLGSSLSSHRPLAPMERESRPLQAPPPRSLIGHHRAAGRWLQDGSYLYLFWKPRWRAGSAQVWPPRGAAGARNMGPRTPLTPLRKLWPSSLEYSCESTCE